MHCWKSQSSNDEWNLLFFYCMCRSKAAWAVRRVRDDPVFGSTQRGGALGYRLESSLE